MAKNTLRIKLDGEVSLADLRTVIDAFNDLIVALSDEAAAGQPILWEIEDLKSGSAVITTRGVFQDESGREAVESVISEYDRIAESVATDQPGFLSARTRDSI